MLMVGQLAIDLYVNVCIRTSDNKYNAMRWSRHGFVHKVE